MKLSLQEIHRMRSGSANRLNELLLPSLQATPVPCPRLPASHLQSCQWEKSQLCAASRRDFVD